MPTKLQREPYITQLYACVKSFRSPNKTKSMVAEKSLSWYLIKSTCIQWLQLCFSWIDRHNERKETQQDGKTTVEYSCLHCQRMLG